MIGDIFGNMLDHEPGESGFSESEKLSHEIADSAPVMIWMSAPDQSCIYFNKSWLDFTGQTLEHELGDGWIGGVHPDDRALCLKNHQPALNGAREFSMTYRLRRYDGEYRWILNRVAPRVDLQGRSAGFIGSCCDVTEQKQVEEALKVGEGKFRALFDSNLIPLCFWQEDGRVADANDAYLQLTGYSREDLNAGRLRCDQLTLPEPKQLDLYPVTELVAGKEKCTPYEKSYQLRDGRRVSVLIGGALLPGHKNCGVAFAIDLSKQKRLEQELHDEKALSHAIFGSLTGHMAVIDRNGVIIAVNDSWTRFARERGGLDGTIGIGVNYLKVVERAADLSDPVAAQALAGIRDVLIGSKKEFFMEYKCDAPARPAWFEMKVAPLRRPEGGGVIVHLDISNRVRIQMEAEQHRQELAHLSRVTMLGELTASLAHELNQPLTAILSNAEAAQTFLKSTKPSLKEIRHILADIVTDSKRAGEVIRRLRALLKRGKSRHQLVSLNQVLKETLKLLHSEMITRNVSVISDLDPLLPLVRGDRIQLQQVILNLLLNGAEAMISCSPERRKLILRTHSDGLEILLAVRDFGAGLDPKSLEKIFEPFYSTKNEGMGMGLWINRAIIQAHGGRLWAANNDDAGATFTVTLPVSEREL
jgi:PAS domain S-box-containing protein